MGKIIPSSNRNEKITIHHCEFCGRSIKEYEIMAFDENGFYHPIGYMDLCTCEKAQNGWDKEKRQIFDRLMYNEAVFRLMQDKRDEYSPAEY